MEPYAGLPAARQAVDQAGFLCIASYRRVLLFLDTPDDDLELMVGMV